MLKRFLLYVLVCFLGFVLGVYTSERTNWRVFVLHDSERVTIKVK